MKNKHSWLFLLALLSVLYAPFIVAKGSNINPFEVMPFKIPKDLKLKLNCYRKCWRRVTGFELSGLHWQQFVVIYTNLGGNAYKKNFFEYMRVYEDEEDEDIPPHFKTYPAGTIIVKENFASDKGRPGTALSLTTMIKHQPGYDPENGDWEYIQTNSSGQYMVGGKQLGKESQKSCQNCHNNVAERDRVFATFYSKQ